MTEDERLATVSERMDQIARPLLASIEAARSRPASAIAGWVCVTPDNWRITGRLGDRPLGLIDFRGHLQGVEVWTDLAQARAYHRAWNRRVPTADHVRVISMAAALQRLVAAHVERLDILGVAIEGGAT